MQFKITFGWNGCLRRRFLGKKEGREGGGEEERASLHNGYLDVHKHEYACFKTSLEARESREQAFGPEPARKAP